MPKRLKKSGKRESKLSKRRRRGKHVPRSTAPPRIRAGAGKRLITPPVGGPLIGIPERDLANGSRGVHDQLHARALVLDNGFTVVALASVDLFAVTRDLTEEIAQNVGAKTGIPPDNVVLVASHTHSGPSASHTAAGDEPDGDWIAVLISEVTNAVEDAFKSARLARVGASVGQCPVTLRLHNRSPEGKLASAAADPAEEAAVAGEPADADLGVIRITDLDGNNIAIVANFACQPSTVRSDGAFLISADFPGILSSLVEKTFPGSVVLFTNGAAADVVHRQHAHENDQTSAGYRDTMLVAELLADETIRLVHKIRPRQRASLAVAKKRITLPLDMKKAPTARAKQSRKAFQAVSKFEKRVLADEQPSAALLDASTAWFIAESRWGPAMAEKVRRGKLSRQVETELWAVFLGNIGMIAAPGEMYCGFGRELKRRSPFKRTFVLGYTGDYLGYLAPRDVYEKGGWEVEEAYKYLPGPGLPLVAGTVEDTLVDHMLSLARSVKSKGAKQGLRKG
jgi:neutral ceramidase